MTTEFLDRLQEDKLQSLETLLDTYDAKVSAGSHDEAAAIADFFVDEGIGIRQNSLRLWNLHWTRAIAGEIENRRAHGALVISVLERSGRLLQRVASAARKYANASGQQVARLAKFEAQCGEFPLWIKECSARGAMLDRPLDPLNPERIAESQAAYARGAGEAVSVVIARLEQGGTLVKG